MEKRQKIYCYVDETGQDAGSTIFIVVAVVVWEYIEGLRSSLAELERRLKIGGKKWHKLRHNSRVEFMNVFLQERHSNVQIYFGRFKKPVPALLPTFEVIQKSLTSFSQPIQAIVNIDGLDALSAKKMTNALRTKYLHLSLVKGSRDESEVLIRLADRWAGCLRLAFLKHNSDCKELVLRAQKSGLLKEI